MRSKHTKTIIFIEIAFMLALIFGGIGISGGISTVNPAISQPQTLRTAIGAEISTDPAGYERAKTGRDPPPFHRRSNNLPDGRRISLTCC